jgi:hypothetical protein
MSVSDPYGLAASGLPPDMLTELAGISRRQQVMNAILQQSGQPIEAPQSHGRFAGRASPLSAVAKIVQAYMGSRGLQDTDASYADLAGRAAQARTQALSEYQSRRDGTAAQMIPSAVTTSDEGEPSPLPPAIKDAVPGDRRAAVAQAMLNPLIANNPLVQADLKRVEPKWTPTKQFNPQTGREERVMVNENEPSQVLPMGGQKAAELKQVTTIDPVTKQPVTTFVNPQEVKTPIPQPVKMEMKDTGSKLEPVNPYSPTALDKTTTPDARLADARQRELNGILEGQGPADLGPTAQLIANYDQKLGPPPTNARNPMAVTRYNQLVAEVKKINPDWSAPNYDASQAGLKAFTSGKQGNTVRSFNVALAHLDTLDKAADALKNGDTPALNKIGNFIAEQTGQAAPTNFAGVKKIVGDEIVKAVVGSGGGVADREEAANTISRANSPAQLKGVIGQYKELMRGQLGGLKQQYEQSTMRKDFDRFLSPAGVKTEHGSASAAAHSGVRVVDW